MRALLKFGRLLLAFLAILTLFIAILWFFDLKEPAEDVFVHTFGDVMDWKSRWIAGGGATNCGSVPVRGNVDAATDCALRAFEAHRPFRVRYGLQTMDTVMAAGVVADSKGRVYEMLFSGMSPTGTVDVIRQRVIVKACPTPTSVRRTPRGRVACFAQGDTSPEASISSWLSDAP